MNKANLRQLNKTLALVKYPTTKIHLIRTAEDKGSDEKVLRQLRLLPSRQYNNHEETLNLILAKSQPQLPQLNLTQLNKVLAELDYPTNKKELIKYAENKGIDERIRKRFKKLPRQIYGNSSQIRQALELIN